MEFRFFFFFFTNFVDYAVFHIFCRLFSCGTSKEGESFLVEWNETEGSIKRTYYGFKKRSLGVVQFDTTRNRFLAAGDEFMIKFWDMDITSTLTTTDAEGGLPVSTIQHLHKFSLGLNLKIACFVSLPTF